MKVLIVSTVVPYPADNGKKQVIQGIVSFLMRKIGVENLTYCIIGDADASEIERRGIRSIRIATPSAAMKVWNVIWHCIATGRKSIQEAMLHDRKLERRVKKLVYDHDIVICDTIRVAQLLEGTRWDRVIHYMDDLFSIRYEKMVAVLKNSRTDLDLSHLLGNFAEFIPAPLRGLVKIKPLAMFLLQLEAQRLRTRESQIVQWFANNLLVNPNEVRQLKERTGCDNITVVKPAIRVHPTRRAFTGTCEFVFLGALNVPHNLFSISYFLHTQMERVIDILPTVKLKIVGRGAPFSLRELCRRYGDHVELKGYVEDLSTVMESACAMIIPLMFGSGIKIKTLEALAAGVPIISTSFGVEGIPVIDGYHCYIRDRLDEFPSLMGELTNIDINNTFSQRSKIFFYENYSAERLDAEYSEIFLKGVDTGVHVNQVSFS